MEATLRSAFRIKGEKAEGHVTRVNTRVLPPRDTRADSARASASVVKLFIYRVSRQKGEEEKRGKTKGWNGWTRCRGVEASRVIETGWSGTGTGKSGGILEILEWKILIGRDELVRSTTAR